MSTMCKLTLNSLTFLNSNSTSGRSFMFLS